MKAAEVIAALQSRGFEIWQEGDTLRYRARAGVLAEREIETLRTHRAALLKALQAVNDEADPLEGLKPYRVNLDGHAQVVWLAPGLSPAEVLAGAQAEHGPGVSLEPPLTGWPRLADIPEVKL